MLGIHWPEFMLIAVVTVLVVGPKELPRVLRTFTQIMRKIRGLSKEFQDTMHDLAKEADLDDMKKDFVDIESRVADMKVEDELDKTLDGDNKIASMFTGDVIGTELAQDAKAKLDPQDEFEAQIETEDDKTSEETEAVAEEGASESADDVSDDSPEKATDKVDATDGDKADTKADAKADAKTGTKADDDAPKAAAPEPVPEKPSAASSAGV